MLVSLLYLFIITSFDMSRDSFEDMLHIKSYYNNSELKNSNSSKYYKTKLGFTNSGLFCWLNASLKLLLEMTDYNDIIIANQEINKDPNHSFSLIRSVFIRMWEVYNRNNSDIKSAESALENLKNKLIRELHNFVNQNRGETYGLKEYFGNHNANNKQDSNLFIIAMINVLKLDNMRHKLQTCNYIEGIFLDSSTIQRKVADGCPLIVYISEHHQDQSLNDYLVRQSQKISGNYYWNANELHKQGINIGNNSGMLLAGNKFETVEASLNFINNFIVYISLNYDDPSFISIIRNNIINLVFNSNFPNNLIRVRDSCNLYQQKQINAVVKTIICFKGSQNCGHYICINLTNGLAIVHDDETVVPVSNYLHDNNTDNQYLGIKAFINMFNYTPCTILYEVQ